MTTPVIPYYPAALDALYETYEGVEADDPGSTALASHDPGVMSSKFIYKPLQDEIINLIDKTIMGGALRIRNETGGTLTYTATPLLYISGFKNNVIAGDSLTQLSACTLYGVRSTNSKHWRVWWTLTSSGTTYTIKLYKDSALLNEVASGSRVGNGAITLTESNSSGITGTITVTYSADATAAGQYIDCNFFLVSKADANDISKAAQVVLKSSLTNNTNGLAYGEEDVTGFDTSGFSAVGSLVYLSAATAGAVATADPGSMNTISQVVGFVSAKDATTGSIRFFPRQRMITRFTQPVGMRCSADKTFTTDTTLATITGMSINLTAGQKFFLRVKLFTSSTVNGGIKVAVAGSASFTSIIAEGRIYNGTTFSTAAQVTAAGTIVNATVVSTCVELEISGVCNAAGTLLIQGAQNASHADTTTYKANSFGLVQNG